MKNARSWLPLIARVEWREEGEAEERPAALLLGGERLELEVLDSRHEGPARSGGRIVTVFEVRDPSGRRLRVRRFADRPTRIELAVEGVA